MLIPTKKNIATVTDLRTRTIDLLKEVEKKGKKFVFQRSNPLAVLLSVERYNQMVQEIEDGQDALLAQELSAEKLKGVISLEKVAKDNGLSV